MRNVYENGGLIGATGGYDFPAYPTGVHYPQSGISPNYGGVDTTFVADVFFPASPTDGLIWETGATGQGAWIGIRDSGTTMRLRGGDGATAKTASDVDTAVVETTDFPKDNKFHQLVWEFEVATGTARIFIDGVLKGESSATGGSFDNGTFAGGGDGAYLTDTNGVTAGEADTACNLSDGGGGLRVYENVLYSKKSGVWDLSAPYRLRSEQPIKLRHIATNYSTTIPANNVTGKTQGFLGVNWQTGFRYSTFPPAVLTPGWTRVVDVTLNWLNSTFWRMTLQVKPLTAAELGGAVSPLTYDGASRRVSLFATDANKPIRGITVSGATASANDPTARPITPVQGYMTGLFLGQFYGFNTAYGDRLRFAEGVINGGDLAHHLRYGSPPLFADPKPSPYISQSGASYLHYGGGFVGVY